MNEFDNDIYLIKEHGGILKFSSHYDIIDPQTGKMIMECKETHAGVFTKFLKLGRHKKNAPFNIIFYNSKGQKLMSIKKGFSIFRSKIEIRDENEKVIGYVRQRLLRIGGKLDVLNINKGLVFSIEGNWIGWEFNYKRDNINIARITKKWTGIGREFLTTSDNYIIELQALETKNPELRKLILSSAVCIDLVLKE